MCQDIIKDMRTRCRMGMNGVASTSMRQRGLDYKVNFGLSVQQIKELASRYDANAELAETLWKENTRELKILATHLYPVDAFTREKADEWVKAIPNQEIREQVCANLFQNLAFAAEAATAWSNNPNSEVRATGYWLLARLLLTKKADSVLRPESLSLIWEDVISENTFLKNAALLALKQIGRQAENTANDILHRLSIYKDDADPMKQEIYNAMDFEFDYFFNK